MTNAENRLGARAVIVGAGIGGLAAAAAAAPFFDAASKAFSGETSGCAAENRASSRPMERSSLEASESVPRASGTPRASQAAASKGSRAKKRCVPGQCTTVAPLVRIVSAKSRCVEVSSV